MILSLSLYNCVFIHYRFKDVSSNSENDDHLHTGKAFGQHSPWFLGFLNQGPSLAEVQDCLRQLVYTPPSNFNGQAGGWWWCCCCCCWRPLSDCGFYEVLPVFSPNSVFFEKNCEVRLLAFLWQLSWVYFQGSTWQRPFQGVNLINPNLRGADAHFCGRQWLHQFPTRRPGRA